MTRQEGVVIAVDFDGTLCENAWPEIGKPHLGVIKFFKWLRSHGRKLILWTCREGQMHLRQVQW